MIRSFANKQTKNVFKGIREKTVPDHLLNRARTKLDRINYAKVLRDLNTPTRNRLERLVGVRKERYSIRVAMDGRVEKYECKRPVQDNYKVHEMW